jgi:hypothetical protein
MTWNGTGTWVEKGKEVPVRFDEFVYAWNPSLKPIFEEAEVGCRPIITHISVFVYMHGIRA